MDNVEEIKELLLSLSEYVEITLPDAEEANFNIILNNDNHKCRGVKVNDELNDALFELMNTKDGQILLTVIERVVNSYWEGMKAT